MFDLDRVLNVFRKVILLALAGSGGTFAGGVVFFFIVDPFSRRPMDQPEISIMPFLVVGAVIGVVAEVFFDVTATGLLWGGIGVLSILLLMGSMLLMV